MNRKPRISERALVNDILAGMSGRDLMEKHHLTPQMLRKKCMELLKARLIKPEQIPKGAYLGATSAEGAPVVRPVTPLSSWGLPGPEEIPDDRPARADTSMFRADARHTGVRYTREGRSIRGLPWAVADLSGGYEPCITEDAVYFPAVDGLHALDARSGAELWNFVPPRRPRGTPAAAEGRVYFGSENGKVYAVDAKTGVEIWSFTAGTEESFSPTLTDDLVLCGNEDGYLSAIERETGTSSWQFKAQRLILHPPAVAGGVVYFSDIDNIVYAIHGQTGRPHWMTSVGGGLLTTPVISGGTIYFGSADKHLYALDARTGYNRWIFRADKPVVRAPCVYEETVYFGTRGGNFYALDARTGTEKWRVNLGKRVTGAPSVVDDVLYVGASHSVLSSPRNKLFALDPATGSMLWEHPTGGGLCTSPVVANGLVYYSTLQQGLEALGCGGPDGGRNAAKIVRIRPDEPEWFRYLLGGTIIVFCAFLWGLTAIWGSAEADPERWPALVSLLHSGLPAVICLLGTGYACLPLVRRFRKEPRSLIVWGLATLGLVPLLAGLGFLTKTATDAVSGIVPGWFRRFLFVNSNRQHR